MFLSSLVLLWCSSKMVSTFGLELVFESVKRDLLKWHDVIVVVLHWRLIVSHLNNLKFVL